MPLKIEIDNFGVVNSTHQKKIYTQQNNPTIHLYIYTFTENIVYNPLRPRFVLVKENLISSPGPT